MMEKYYLRPGKSQWRKIVLTNAVQICTLTVMEEKVTVKPNKSATRSIRLTGGKKKKTLSKLQLFGVPLILCLALIMGCSTPPETVQEKLPEKQAEEPVKEEPVQEQIEEPKEEPAEETVIQEEPPKEEAVIENQEPETQEEEFVVTEELYSKTFQDVSKLIEELNTIIQAEDYEEWLLYLTDDYKNYYSNPDVLKEQSEKPLLKRYNIRLRTLKDYFIYVVVRSRQTIRLDAIEFIDETHVKATMLIDGTPYILYYLENKGKAWKIGRY
jgi:hypothetical protein